MGNLDKEDRSQVKAESWWQRIGRWLIGKHSDQELWGQKFDRVKGGLSQEQIIQYVEDLEKKHQAELKQQAESATPHGVLNRIITLAEQEADALRSQAKQDADVESARIISEAKQKAQEVLTSSKQEARVLSKEEVRNILKAANDEAEIIKSEAKHVAQSMDIRVRENVQKEITSDIMESYYQLLYSLQDLITVANNLEAEWKRKIAQLWGPSHLELGDSPASLSATQQTRALERSVKTGKGVAEASEAPPPVEIPAAQARGVKRGPAAEGVAKSAEIEEKANKAVEAAAKAREASAKAKREAEAKAKHEAEEKARREAEVAAKAREAEAKAKHEAEEKARKEAEKKAEAAAKAREAEARAKREAEIAAKEKAKREAQEAEEKARKAAEAAVKAKEAQAKANQEVERIKREAQEADEKARKAAEVAAKAKEAQAKAESRLTT